MSTRNKIILLVVCPLLILSIGIGVFSMRSVEKTMLEEQRRNSDNSMTLAVGSVLNRYDILFRAKAEQATALKDRLNVVISTLSALSEREEDVPVFLRAFPLPAGLSLIAVDNAFKPVVLRGEMGAVNPFLTDDIKGRPTGSTMWSLAEKGLPATCVVRLAGAGAGNRVYGSSFYSTKAGLLIGLWTDISHLEEKQQHLANQSLEDLKTTLASIRIGPSGFLLVVDADAQVMVGAERIASLHGLVNVIAQMKNLPQKELSMDAGLLTGEVGREVLLSIRRAVPFDWYVLGLAYADEASAPGKRLSLSLALAILGAMLVLLPLAIWIAARLTSPLSKLSSYARSIPEQNFLEESPSSNELAELVRNKHSAEISELASSFQFMDKTIRLRVRELMEASAVRERLEGELQAATEIQLGFMPRPLPEEVSANRFSVAASFTPAREVGGDLYDLFMLDTSRLCFVIGDVSDKGMPAALFMSMVMTLIRSRARSALSPEDLMREVNDSLSKDNPKCMFVTLFIGVLNLRTGEVDYVNGGHNPPLLLGAKGEITWVAGLSGPVVGALENITFAPLKTRIFPGDLLFLYTDGLNEAMNKDNVMYGNEQMEQIVANSERTPIRMLDAVLVDVASHTRGHPASDDMTMLCLHYLGTGFEETP